MSKGQAILASLRQQVNLSEYKKTHWEGSFTEYLDIVRERHVCLQRRHRHAPLAQRFEGCARLG